MSTDNAPFAVANSEGTNTRIHYVMRSDVKKLKEADIVIEGRLSPEDIETIRQYMVENNGFRPDSAGVPDLVELMPLSWVPRGDERHEIDRISYTNSKANSNGIDAEHFASAFENFDYRAVLKMG